jgi:asparagine synthase (glutamine-hydrolysing)
MSGIAGIVHFDGAPVAPDLIEKMTSAMAQRGPDGIDHRLHGSVALGQCMLRTTPESLEEHQPLCNEDGRLVLVMDGRVDNYEELRRELLARGARLRDRSDAELVLTAYEVWGEDCPDRIIGEFVFFIWDARQQRLFGARDAAGTRHFYYHAGDGWFAFASEIKGLLALGRIEPKLNESRLLDYLVDEFDRDDEIGSFYQGIDRIPAGHAISVTDQGVKTWRYWNPGKLPALEFASQEECEEAFLEQLRVAVKCRLRSIGPVGAMLSGGMDSSSIVGLISKEFRADLAQPLKTFSLIREDRENCPDWRAIREMLKDDWLDPVVITSALSSDLCRTYFDNIKNLNEPFALSQGFTDSLVFDAARQNGCRVVLDGMAGDLLFYSFDRSLDCILREKRFAHIPALFAACRRHGIDNGLWRAFAWKSLRLVTPEKVRVVYRKLRDRKRLSGAKLWGAAGDILNLLHRETARQFLATRYAQRQQAAANLKPGNDQRSHARNFTSGLLSFAHEVNGQIALSMGVEPRSPFSDRRVIEFAIRMPLAAKLCVPWYKHMLRNCMAGILPEEVRWRPDIGNHPGWKFFERLSTEMAQNAPEIWNRPIVDGTLGRWIDASMLTRSSGEYLRGGGQTVGGSVFGLAILAKWLEFHPHSIRSAE